MDGVSLDTIASAFGFNVKSDSDWSTLGKVTAVNQDGTISALLGGSATPTTCAAYCYAEVGDIVFVVISKGKARAIARQGGDGAGAVTLPLSVADGGTGADNASDALTNLGLGLPVPIASGGTDADNASDAFDNLFTVTPLTFTRNTSNTSSVSVNLCVRIGRLVIFSCDGSLSTAGRAAWTDTPLGELNVTSTAWVYALGRTNTGQVFTAQIKTNEGIINYRTLDSATTDAPFRFTLVFVCNEAGGGGGGGDLPAYTGDYESTPSFDEQVYPTANKAMTDDFTVHEIDVQNVDNTAGGVTLTI